MHDLELCRSLSVGSLQTLKVSVCFNITGIRDFDPTNIKLERM